MFNKDMSPRFIDTENCQIIAKLKLGFDISRVSSYYKTCLCMIDFKGSKPNYIFMFEPTIYINHNQRKNIIYNPMSKIK